MKNAPAVPNSGQVRGRGRGGLVALLLAAATTSCGSTPRLPVTASNEAGGSPLGPSYVLLPLPTEDHDLLGRMLPEPPQPGRSLEETARANPCGDKLGQPKETPLASTFEDAEELTASASARAMLGSFGFSGDLKAASHFFYRLETGKRIAAADTTEYAACCKEQGSCGYGYVSALIHGDGEYATASDTSAGAGMNVGMVDVAGGLRLKVLHKRKVRGWLAAVVTVTDSAKVEALGPLGVAKAAGITEDTVPGTVKELYEQHKMVVRREGETDSEFVFVAGREEIGENEFVRRFRNVTGSNDLDEFERRRNTGTLVLAGSLTAASAALATLGFLTLTRDCTNADVGAYDSPPECSEPVDKDDFLSEKKLKSGATTVRSESVFLAAFGSAATIGFGIWTIIAFVKPDGSESSHNLTGSEATLLAQRYNRALLRQTVRKVSEARREDASIRLKVGPTGAAIVGSF